LISDSGKINNKNEELEKLSFSELNEIISSIGISHDLRKAAIDILLTRIIKK